MNKQIGKMERRQKETNIEKLYAKMIPMLLLTATFILFLITRLWRLNNIPSGLHLDEAGMAYDAWCLANYGTDRYMNSWPLYLINYGGGQSILYAYLCAGLFKLFGYSIWLVRLPIVCSSFLTFFFGYKIAQKIYEGNRYLPVITGFLITVCPYFIMNSRYGIDCNLMLGMSTMFLYFFSMAIGHGKMKDYVLAGITGGLMLYSYALSYVVLLLFLLFSFIYTIITKSFSLKKWVCMGAPMGMIATPLIIVQCINMFHLPELKVGAFTFTKLDFYRVGELGPFQWSNFTLMLKSMFSGDGLNYTSVPRYGTLYGITILLFAVGLISAFSRLFKSIRKGKVDLFVVVFLWFAMVLLLFCHMLSNIYRINSIFFVTILLAVEGIRVISCRLKQLPAYGIYLSFVCAYCICFVRFGIYYFGGSYTLENYPLDHFDICVTEAIDFLEEHPEYYHQGTYMAQGDVHFALSALADPSTLDLDPHVTGHTIYDYYHCGTLPEIDLNYNYIVRDIFPEYAAQLRSMGYNEIQYPCYSLFYQE